MNVVVLVSIVLRLFLVIIAVVGFFGIVVGIPTGIILFVMKKNKKLVLWLIIGGPILLIGTFIIWALLALLNAFFGLSILSFPGVQ